MEKSEEQRKTSATKSSAFMIQENQTRYSSNINVTVLCLEYWS